MPSGGEVCAGGFMASEFGMHLSHCPRIAFGRGGSAAAGWDCRRMIGRYLVQLCAPFRLIGHHKFLMMCYDR